MTTDFEITCQALFKKKIKFVVFNRKQWLFQDFGQIWFSTTVFHSLWKNLIKMSVFRKNAQIEAEKALIHSFACG